MIKHVYIIGYGRANHEKKTFEVLQDIIKVDKQLTQEDIEKTAQENECDIKATYIGKLEESTEADIQEMAADYHTPELISEIMKQWQSESEEV